MDNLDNLQKDALAEVGNISLGAAATALSQIVNEKVQITTPRVSLENIKDIRASFPRPCVIVTVKYITGLTGENIFIVNQEDALFIVGMMMGMEPPQKPDNLGELELSAISEAMNQMMGSAATAMSEIFLCPIEISPPRVEYKHLQAEDIDRLGDDTSLIQVAFRMTIDEFLDSELLQLIPIDHGVKMASSLLSGLSEEKADAGGEREIKNNGAVQAQGDDYFTKEEVDLYSSGDGIAPPAVSSSGQAEEEAFFSDLLGEQANLFHDNEDPEKINLIRDIQLEISAVLGKKRLSLKEVFSLHPGELITLEHQLGEPLELFVNEKLVARGEVVLVNGQFGIRITDMMRSRS